MAGGGVSFKLPCGAYVPADPRAPRVMRIPETTNSRGCPSRHIWRVKKDQPLEMPFRGSSSRVSHRARARAAARTEVRADLTGDL